MEEMKSFAGKTDPHIPLDNPYYEGVRYHIQFIEKYVKAEEEWLEKDPSLDEPATVAQALHAYMNTIWEVMAFYGRTYKALTYEEEGGRSIPHKLKKEAKEKLRKNIKKFEDLVEYKVIPPGNLAKIQLTAIVSTIAQKTQ